MNFPVSTAADSLLSMVPVLVASLLACMAWYVICRFLMRSQDAEWYAALPVVPEVDQAGDYDVQIRAAELRLATLHVQAHALARGKPSDRLFAFGLFVAAVIAIAATAFLLAFSPADL